MAKESVDIPMIPEVTMSSRVALRRHSAGIPNSGNNEKKVVPHYLRASTGSCHDFCKYGRKNVEEAKETISMTKRAGRIPLHPTSEQNIGVIVTSVPKLKAPVDSKPTRISSVKNSESVDSKSDISKLELPTKSDGCQIQRGNEVMENKKKASLFRVKSSFLTKSHISSAHKTRRQGISSILEMVTPSKSAFKRVETTPISTSGRVKTRPKSTFQMIKTSSKSVSKMKKTSPKVSSFEDKEMECSEKHVTSLNPDLVTMKTTSSVNSSREFGAQRNSKIKLNKREAYRTVSTNARKHKGLKIVSHHMNQPKPRKVEPAEHNNEAEEKTLYVIKMESANQTLQSDQNESQDIELSLSNSSSSPKFSSSSNFQSLSQEHQEESEYATSESVGDSSSGNNEIEHMEYEETLEVEENEKPEKEIVCSENKECQKFKENLAETHKEKGILGKLKFWRGKVLEDNATYVKGGADTEKVVLRHQDVQVKKDGRILYNNVIEETAGKLVETQKSKVKALVDAFETVISLQEKRTRANIVK
ncbi:hypothetical protein RJT34_18335 [Clitoria ternatea]|uniref:Calmodulin-binding domain-containing protein n=1 Tax=Clitoria ternatea TaxID=43366 RepID=A0AAN9PFQ6_CLITE